MSRRIMMGMFDRSAQHGTISGSGPGFERAMRKFERRQRAASKNGVWRCAPAKWKSADGTYVDPDWFLVEKTDDNANL